MTSLRWPFLISATSSVGTIDLVDVVLHVERGDPVLEVGLHPVLHAGVGVHDEPVAGLARAGPRGTPRAGRPAALDGLVGHGLGGGLLVPTGRSRRAPPRPRRPRRRGLRDDLRDRLVLGRVVLTGGLAHGLGSSPSTSAETVSATFSSVSASTGSSSPSPSGSTRGRRRGSPRRPPRTSRRQARPGSPHVGSSVVGALVVRLQTRLSVTFIRSVAGGDVPGCCMLGLSRRPRR